MCKTDYNGNATTKAEITTTENYKKTDTFNTIMEYLIEQKATLEQI